MIVENFIGRIYDSNNFGKFKIIDEAGYVKNDRKFVIQFLDTGYITEALYTAIRHGRVRDRLVPNIAGVGCIGSDITITDEKYYTYYKSWNDMMNRCYNRNWFRL